MTLVLDANVAVAACAESDGFGRMGDDELVAPPILWSEFFSLVHEARFRGELDAERATLMLDRLETSPLQSRLPEGLHRAAWRMADRLGHARTYDAEYVALAQLLGCRLVTLDLRLRRGAEQLGFVFTPTELSAARDPEEDSGPEGT